MEHSKYFKTEDGAKIHYIEYGSGQPVVMLHGWSQSAELFRYQIDKLSEYYKVIAIDMRGHGLSEKAEHGYRISRLSKDLYEFLNELNLSNIVILAHSMGCAVLWCYWDMFGGKKLSKLILVDQEPFMTINPNWSNEEREIAGAGVNYETLFDVTNAISGPNGKEFSSQFITGRFTSNIDEQTLNWVISQNMLLPRNHAATLLFNHCTQDWRDVIPSIDIPTLIITGQASNKPLKSQEWINQKITGSQLENFDEDEGGSHFMFIENPVKFNEIVIEFINS